MTRYGLSRRLCAEALGTAFLVCTVIGSGIMADRLSDDVALVLLANTIPTGAILVVLITIFGPVSGAHLNPAVSVGFLFSKVLSPAVTAFYVLAQIVGGIFGTIVAHLMFEMDPFQVSETVRTGAAQWFAEWVATFGLMATIVGAIRFRPDAVGWMVGLYITAAYWFTASTSFANPAVAIARGFTSTFSGIRPSDLPGFICAEIAGAICAAILMAWLFDQRVPKR